MSTSVGFAFTSNDDSLQQAIAQLLLAADIGVAIGIQEFEFDVRDGVALLAEAHGLNVLMTLRSPRDLAANLAPGIEQDLMRHEVENVSPLFFDLLRRVQRQMSEKGAAKLFVLFASEWEADEEVRFGYGNVEDLISVLGAPGHWCMRLMDLKTGRQWNSDRYPFVFELQI